jgi:ring-1,2-phenylacetyl-CoA epoxidase subunit PaaD
MVAVAHKADAADLYELLSTVCDPEIPVLTLQDLGVLRDISVDDDGIRVSITPTYAGCPAMEVMRSDIEFTLAEAGYPNVIVEQKLSPAWTTDWMSEEGRNKLRTYGIAPPATTSCGKKIDDIECPQCNSRDVKMISEFGSTACKALYQCQDCKEPFDYFKCI